MSDDYDYDGDGDADNDGVLDSQELDSDVHNMAGNELVSVDGRDLYQGQDPFGNTVLMDADRNVVATVEPDGDIRMEDGPTYTSTDSTIGRDFYHGTDGSMMTPTDGLTGITDYDITGGNDGDTDDGPEAGDASVVGVADVADGGGDEPGEGQYEDGEALPDRRRPSSRIEARSRRPERKEGAGCFFMIFFVLHELASVFGISYIFWLQHLQAGVSRPVALVGVMLVVALYYIITAIIWLVTGRLFLFFDMKKADCLTWLMTFIMLITPLIAGIAMIWA